MTSSREACGLKASHEACRVTGWSHVALGVVSVEAVLPFYQGFLGLEILLDHEETWTRTHEIRRRAVYLAWPDAPMTTFMVIDERYGEPDRAPCASSLGIHHFSFLVDDVERAHEAALSLDVAVVRAPQTHDGAFYGRPGGRAVRTALFRDPEGNVVQLDQWL